MSQLTTRDYKGTGRRGEPPGGLKEFLLGALAGALLAGLGTALVMHHVHQRSPACAPAHTTPAPASASPAAGHPAASASVSHAHTDLARASASHRGHAAAPPQYDFYQMLPKLKVAVPTPTAPGAQAVGPNGHARFAGYILQVGAYRDEAQAHKVVNYLDSLGILAHINPMRSGGATLYRVRIGPIVEQRELERFRGVLKRIGLPGVLIPGATH